MMAGGNGGGIAVAKKDASAAVLGMLSAAGAQTRPVALDPEPSESPPPPAAADAWTSPLPEIVTPPAAPQVSTDPALTDARAIQDHALTNGAPVASEPSDGAPRTLRLRAATASMLRAAWLEAKRDDVLLTAQDFASNLVDEALAARRRRARSARST
jgi:hypothetical protein